VLETAKFVAGARRDMFVRSAGVGFARYVSNPKRGFVQIVTTNSDRKFLRWQRKLPSG